MKHHVAWAIVGPGAAVVVVAWLWVTVKAWGDSPEIGRRFLFSTRPWIQIRYVFDNWDTMKAPIVLWLVGVVTLVAGLVASR